MGPAIRGAGAVGPDEPPGKTPGRRVQNWAAKEPLCFCHSQEVGNPKVTVPIVTGCPSLAL